MFNSSAIPVSMLFFAQFNSTSYTSIFCFFGAVPSYIHRKVNAVATTLRCYLFYITRARFISSINQSIAVIVPVLTTFLQLKCQGINDQNRNPFATHPRTMTVAVSSTVVYYLTYIALLRYPLRRFAVAAHHCLVWSGYASVASLASVLFPDSVSPFVYAIFVSISAGELLYSLYHKLVAEEEDEEAADFQAYKRRVRQLFRKICRVAANSSGQQPAILPV